ncbi:TPA: sulfite reductase subunit alpha [Candidatus Thalassarchaeaceae archaeon]|nr:sulfite reductase subunit alpha [Euryarchaeota archaeon]DAC67226.1 MAG TPA: sulfite reductase subunit alpha [Candidatus Poseidoniales archaeon]HII43292.1 sulfite reductase subunit alpha [Candidatus Thalassarchaeaceae archaeon]
MSDWSAKNPYGSKLTENYILNSEGSRKETRHIVFDLGDSGLEYKAGDALGVIPHCPPELVDDLLAAANFSGDEMVETHLGEATLRDALADHLEIHRVSKKWIVNLGNRLSSDDGPVEIRIARRHRVSTEDGALLVDWSGSGEGEDVPTGYEEIGVACDPAESLWRELTENADSMEDYMWSRDYIDALGDFGHIGFSAQQLVDGMDRLKPRLYSIASSPDHEPGTVHLTVAIVRYNHHGRDRAGLCTGFLSDYCDVGETEIGVFMSPTRSFILPEDGDTDCIMVGPGTGIAPFRAYLQQRDINGDKGRNWLFFGDRTEAGEYYYREEMADWKERGVLNRHDLAWSRDGDEKVYVQHLMRKNGVEIWNWIDGGAYFYVCGDKNYMAKDVHQTLIDICEEHGGMSAEEAKEFVEVSMMKTQKRYLRDVY